MPDIRLRDATPQDCDLLLELIRELARYEKLEHEMRATTATLRASLFGQSPTAYAVLAEIDGKPAGFCLYFFNFSTFLGKPGIYIEDIYVRDAYRSHGIGRKFFERMSEIARERNCGRVEWSVLDWNQPAIDFYTRLGAGPMSEWTVWRLPVNP